MHANGMSIFAALLATAGAMLMDGHGRAAVAQDARLEGSWSGGGSIEFASGDRERARCRASFSPQSTRTYRMYAVCATPSARVEQTASLRRVSPDSFAGQFYNQEYNVSRSIRITVQGNKLQAALRGEAGSANLSLTR